MSLEGEIMIRYFIINAVFTNVGILIHPSKTKSPVPQDDLELSGTAKDDKGFLACRFHLLYS